MMATQFFTPCVVRFGATLSFVCPVVGDQVWYTDNLMRIWTVYGLVFVAPRYSCALYLQQAHLVA